MDVPHPIGRCFLSARTSVYRDLVCTGLLLRGPRTLQHALAERHTLLDARLMVKRLTK